MDVLQYLVGLFLPFIWHFSYADENEVRLYHHLMNSSRYERAIRPTPSYHLTTNVTFGFLLHQVINVDEKNQQLTTSSWMNVNWKDDRLTWNDSDWHGIKKLHIPHERIWKPDIILTNNADPEYKEAAVSTDVFVKPDGNVTWLFFAIYQSSCMIRVRFYPFDDQVKSGYFKLDFSCVITFFRNECNMTFASWSHDADDVNLLLLTESGDLSNYVYNSEWDLLTMNAKRSVLKFSANGADWPVITITIKLRRRPLFYVFNHILPCVLISIMSMLGFYIPAETGEKVTMCITTMLSMGVFLKTITETMPPTSESVPLIGVYYGVSLFIVCAATVINVITLNVHNRGYKNNPEPVPPWARRWILGCMARMLFITIHPADSELFYIAEQKRCPADEEELERRREAWIYADASSNIKKYTQNLQKHRRNHNVSRKQSAIEYEYELESLRRLSMEANNLNQTLSSQFVPFRQSLLTPASAALSNQQRLLYQHQQHHQQQQTVHNFTPPNNSPWLSPNLSQPSPLAASGGGGSGGGSTPSTGRTGESSFTILRKEFEMKFYKVLKKVYHTLEQNELRLALQEERTRIMWEWKQLAIIIDRLLLWLFIVATGLTTFLILFEPILFQETVPIDDTDGVSVQLHTA